MKSGITEYKPEALLIAAPFRDDFSQFSDFHLPLSESNYAYILKNRDIKADFICIDASYDNADQIYADYRLL